MMNVSESPQKLLVLCLLLTGFLIPQQTFAQQTDQYSSVKEALSRSGQLSGSNGPSNVTWIDNGNRYSYMQYNQETESMEIRAYDPATQEDELIFNNTEHTFPNSDSTFEYSSFQWSNDS
jgi:dipeptidyl-peptidase-4